MFNSFDASEPIVRPRLPASKALTTRAQVKSDAALSWGVKQVDTLLETFFKPCFPNMDVVWGILEESKPNAFVWGSATPRIVLLTSGAIREISATRTRLATPAATFASNYAFPAATVPEGDTDARAQALAQAGENLGVFALAALFAHEVGHVHDRQSALASNGQLGRALEIAADTWAIRACTELAVGWARSIAGQMAMPLEFPLRAALYYMFVGHGLIDNIDWSVSWVQDDSKTHPPGALRLAAAAVAASEWMANRRVLDEDNAATIAVEVFAVAAQTLHWLRTGNELPPEDFQSLFCAQHNENVIDGMRVAYEQFRDALV